MKDQGRSTRKRTGGRLKPASNKKRHQHGRGDHRPEHGSFAGLVDAEVHASVVVGEG